MFEYPPILSGTTEEQIRQLREFLFRVIQKLNEEDSRYND